jgi:hypothetical protein
MAPSHRENIKKKVLDEMMNCLAREYGSLKPGDPRRAQIAEQLSELSLLAKEFQKPELIQ